MNLPNAMQHYQKMPNEATDFGFSSTHLNESDKDKMESSFQLDQSVKCPSPLSGSHDKIQRNDLYYFGYDRCIDTNAIEYRANNLNYSYENFFETNTTIAHQCTQSAAYNINYGNINEPSNETGKFLLFVLIWILVLKHKTKIEMRNKP